MLVYAYNHSVYYRKTFKQAGITEENIKNIPLSAFPIIDKTKLLKHFDELVTVSDLKQEELRRFDAKGVRALSILQRQTGAMAEQWQ